MANKRVNVIKKLFGSKKQLNTAVDNTDEVFDDANAILREFRRLSSSRRHTVDVENIRGELTDEALMAAAGAKYAGLLLTVPQGGSQDDCTMKQRRTVSPRKQLPGSLTSGPDTMEAARRSSSNGIVQRLGTVSSMGVGPSAVTVAASNKSGFDGQKAGRTVPSRTTSHTLGPPAHTAKPNRTGSLTSKLSNGSLRRRSVRRDRRESTETKVDTTKPLVFPTTPETIIEYHKWRPFLDENEEWLLVELNEYECLVDGLPIIKIIAKHSKFFEVEPAELWEEFFEFVDDVPSYDEVINFDVWQEFRDKKYTC